MHKLLSLDDAIAAVNSGKTFLVAGDAALLKQLPRGHWIGGTTVYFMTEQGGQVDRERVFLTELFPSDRTPIVKSYREAELSTIPQNYPVHGCSFILLPGGSRVHFLFARDCQNYDGLLNQPLVGWVSGVHLDEVGKKPPLVFDGTTGESFSDRALVMHVEMAREYDADIEIINPYLPGSNDIITFSHTGFISKDCVVNGQAHNFAEYVQREAIDTRLPLIADSGGALINVSFQGIDEEQKLVRTYAPVFEDVQYRFAKLSLPLEQVFAEEFERLGERPVFCCNCILNFLYAELEGKKSGRATGPITFGEIAYVLLNQTLVYVTLEPNHQ